MLACSQKSGEFDFKRDFSLYSNFIDLDCIFNYSKDRVADFKKKIGIPERAKVIGSAGTIGGLKNTKFAIEVFEEFHKTNDSVYMVLIGGGDESDINEVKSMIAKKNLGRFVKLAGYIKDMRDIKHIFDVYINTSLSEGMSISILEAQACGIPCVVSNGVPDTNNAGLPIYLKCNTFQTSEWVDNMNCAFTMDTKIRNEQIKNAFIANKMEKNRAVEILLNIIYGKGENSRATNNDR